jgi:hypothetical protein
VRLLDVLLLIGTILRRNGMSEQQELINKAQKLAEELGGEYKLLNCYDPKRSWKKIEIVFNKEVRNDRD